MSNSGHKDGFTSIRNIIFNDQNINSSGKDFHQEIERKNEVEEYKQ